LPGRLDKLESVRLGETIRQAGFVKLGCLHFCLAVRLSAKPT
jgi:hypothetical protein